VTIRFESGVSVFDGTPFVVLRWGQETGQLTPAEAREHALAVLEAAAAAEHDALVFAELRDGRAGLSMEAAATFLVALRRRRAAGEAG
jgi:hypothetical protein